MKRELNQIGVKVRHEAFLASDARFTWGAVQLGWKGRLLRTDEGAKTKPRPEFSPSLTFSSVSMGEEVKSWVPRGLRPGDPAG